MAKTNRKGRTKGHQFIKLDRGVTESAAWRSLSCEARSLLIAMWERYNGSNNGSISFGIREAKANLNIGSTRAGRAFAELQQSGFIILRADSSFDYKAGASKRLARVWELTPIECDGKPAKRPFRFQQKQNAAPETRPFGTQDKTVGQNRTRRIGPNGTRGKTDNLFPDVVTVSPGEHI